MMNKIKVYISNWCPDCRSARRFLNERNVAFDEVDVDESPDAEELVLQVNNGRRKVPTFEVDGRFFASSPFNARQIAEELKLNTSK